MERLAATALTVLVAASPALAGVPVELRRPAAADGVVAIEAVSGSLKVRGWGRAEVEVTGTLGRGVERLALESSGHLTEVRVEMPTQCRRCEDSELVVRVPRGSRVEVTAPGADVDVAEVEGAVAVTTASADVTIAGAPREVAARTTCGRIEISGVAGPVRATTVSGDVKLTGVTGRIEASSVSGEVLVTGGRITHAELGTTSGLVRFAGGLAPAAYLKVAGVSGDIELLLPPDLDASVEVSTFSGEIANEMGLKAFKAGPYSPEKELRFTAGAGRGRIEATSFSGTVRLRRR